jgi:hypothetical protein
MARPKEIEQGAARKAGASIHPRVAALKLEAKRLAMLN